MDRSWLTREWPLGVEVVTTLVAVFIATLVVGRDLGLSLLMAFGIAAVTLLGRVLRNHRTRQRHSRGV